jgi:hypothetical protein
MKPTTCLHRPALAGIAALGLTTIVLLAPAAHADTEVDPPEGPASTVVVADVEGVPGAAGEKTAVEAASEETATGPTAGTGEEVAAEAGEEVAAGPGEKVAAEAGEQAPAGTIEEAAPDSGDAPLAEGEAAPADGEAAPPDAEQDDLCVDGVAGDVQAAETGTAGTDDAVLNDATAEEGTAEEGTAEEGTAEDGTAEEGTDDSAGLPDAAPSGEGTTVVDPGCAVTTPDQAGNGPGGQDGDGTQLPVGGVDAGKGEATGQNMVLPIATAGALAAAVSLGAYTLVRRRRSDA